MVNHIVVVICIYRLEVTRNANATRFELRDLFQYNIGLRFGQK